MVNILQYIRDLHFHYYLKLKIEKFSIFYEMMTSSMYRSMK